MSNPNALVYRVSDLLGPTYVPVNPMTGLDINGHCPVDASAAINAFIGQATLGRPVRLIRDIGIACYGSILLPTAANQGAYPTVVTGSATGNVEICGDGGIYMMPGSNSHAISGNPGRLGDGNYPLFDPGGTAPAQTNNHIRISGGIINGNRGTGVAVATPTATITLGSNQITVSAATSIAIGQLVTGTGLKSPSFVSAIAGTTVTLVDQTGKPANATASGSGVTVSFYASNSTTGDPRGIITPSGGFNNVTWYTGIDLFAASDVTIEDVYLVGIPTYGCRLGNISYYTVRGCNFDYSAIKFKNTDGVHIDGPANEGIITGCAFDSVYDDAIAFNAPEGYGGDIYDHTISNCTFKDVLSFWRTYTKIGTGTQFFVHDVAISNLTGSIICLTGPAVYGSAIYAGLGQSASGMSATTVWNVQVSNVTVECSNTPSAQNYTFLKLEENVGQISLDNCAIMPAGNASPIPFIRIVSWGGTSGHTIGSISLSNCRAFRSTVPGSHASSVFLLRADAAVTITSLDTDFQLEQDAGYAQGAYYLDPTNVTITRWYIRRLDPTPFAALINGSVWTGLTITGEGLVGCGFQIPDANVGNNTMYKSATTAGELTWKDGAGAVHGLAAGS